jgi:hypothetical protein
MDLSGEMEDNVNISHYFFEKIVIPDIPIDQFEVTVPQEMPDVHQVTVQKIIQANNRIAILYITVTEVRTHKSSATRDENLHTLHPTISPLEIPSIQAVFFDMNRSLL